MSSLETLIDEVREFGTLDVRLKECQRRIATMCSSGHPPRMSMPVQSSDDDFFISTTIADAIEALQSAKEALASRLSIFRTTSEPGELTPAAERQ